MKRDRSGKDEEAVMPSAKKKRGQPPAQYVCKACGKGGHYINDCLQCVRKVKKDSGPVKEDEARTQASVIMCECGEKAKKRRFMMTNGPTTRWVCASSKCSFNKSCASKERVNSRYIERAAKRKAKSKLFISGLPFKFSATMLRDFFDKYDVSGLQRVIPLLNSEQRFKGQAYAIFSSAEYAQAALKLSGKKLRDRWLDISLAREEESGRIGRTKKQQQ